jgi:viroplasmin and RNaseH domain-containing protein
MTWYVVYTGWVLGVYDMWVDCQKQVHKFSGNYYKGYAAREETVAKWRNCRWTKNQIKTLVVLSFLLSVIAGVLYLILV